MEDVHPAVELLLKRIETHPDEFALTGGRWDKMISQFEPYFSEAEHDAVLAAVSRVRLDAMHKELMQEMLNPPAKPEYNLPFADVTPPTWTSLQQGSLLANGLTTTTVSATAASLRELYDRGVRYNRPDPVPPLLTKGFTRALKGIFS